MMRLTGVWSAVWILAAAGASVINGEIHTVEFKGTIIA